MLNILGKRKDEKEDFVKKLVEAEREKEEMKKRIEELTLCLSKANGDLQEERIVHAKAKEAFEEVSKAAEENEILLKKEIETKDSKIEELLFQLKASEAKSDELSAALCLSQMRSSQVDSQEYLFEEAMGVCKKMDKMISDLGSKARKMTFSEGDTHEAIKWCSSTMDVLPKIMRAFGGFSCMAGSQCLTALLERQGCSHISSIIREVHSCSSKDLKNKSSLSDNIGKQILSCWEKGWIEDAVRDLIVTLRLQVCPEKLFFAICDFTCSKFIFYLLTG